MSAPFLWLTLVLAAAGILSKRTGVMGVCFGGGTVALLAAMESLP